MKYRVLMIAAGAVLLAACGSKEEENVVAPTPVAVKRPVVPTDPTAGMAIAPADDKKGDGDLVVKYTLASVPQAGKPLEVELAFKSTVDLPEGTLSYSAQPDVRLGSDVTAALPALTAGQVERRTTTITTQKAGITYFSVSATTGQAANATTRTFSIPLIVGDGSVAAPVKTPAATAPKKPA